MVKIREFSYFNTLLVIITLLVIGCLIYSSAVFGEFVSDDHITIVNNPAVRDIGNLQELFRLFNTRFFVGFTFAVNYHFGGLDVFGYHLTNILIHIFTSFLIFRFVEVLFRTPALKQHKLSSQSTSIAYLASLIFLCHPIQTQGVAFITQRAVLMATLFYVGTLILYMKARLTDKRKYYFSAIGTMAIGLFCKENTVTLPLMLLVLEWFFFDSLNASRWTGIKKTGPFFVMSTFLPLSLYMEGTKTVLGLREQVEGMSIKWNYFLTEINVLRTYLRLFLLPINQNHYYDYPITNSLFDPLTVFSLCLLAALIAAAVYFLSRQIIVSFCIVWFFITTSVEFAVVSIVGRGVIYEHWMYLPMAGYALFLSYMIHAVVKNKRNMQLTIILLIVVMCLGTYQRNKVWKEEIGFWEDVISKSPNNAIANFAAGSAYQRRGDFDTAMQLYKKGLTIDPNFKLLINNIGILYGLMEKDDVALYYFKKALSIDPDYVAVYNNIAYIYYLNGSYEDAIRYYNESILRDTTFPDSYFYRGKSYMILGKSVEAKLNFQKALEMYKRLDLTSNAEETLALIEGLPQY